MSAVGLRNSLLFHFRLINTNPLSLYLHCSNAKSLKVFNDKKQRIDEKESYKPLSYRQVVNLTNACKTQFLDSVEELTILIEGLDKLRQKKQAKQKKSFRVTNLIYSFWERIANAWDIYKWKTTSTLEHELTTSLRKSLEKSKVKKPVEEDGKDDSQKPVPPVPPDKKPFKHPETNTSPKLDTTNNLQNGNKVEKEDLPPSLAIHTIDQTTISPTIVIKKPPPRPFLKRNTQLEDYRSNPEDVNWMSKRNLFGGISSIEPVKGQQQSFVDLLQNLSGSQKIRLEGVCLTAVADMLDASDKEGQEQLIVWLKKQPTLPTELLLACLSVYIKKNKEEKSISVYALSQLLHILIAREGAAAYSYPNFAEGMIILLEIEPNNKGTIALVELLCEQNDFHQETYLAWIAVLDQKETTHHKTLENPVRDMLENKFPAWKTARIVHAKSKPEVFRAKSMAEISPNPDDVSANNLTKHQRTPQKTHALERYQQSMDSDFKCTTKEYSIIFRDIKFAKKHSLPIANREITSAEDLVLFTAAEKTINLEISQQQQAIIDIIAYCEKPVSERAVEWACSHPTFCPQLFLKLLSVYVESFSTMPTNKIDGLKNLLATYLAKDWIQQGIAPNHPTVKSSVVILLTVKPNEAFTEKVIFFTHPFLTEETRQAFLDVFTEKDRLHAKEYGSTVPPVHHALRNLLEKKEV